MYLFFMFANLHRIRVRFYTVKVIKKSLHGFINIMSNSIFSLNSKNRMANEGTAIVALN